MQKTAKLWCGTPPASTPSVMLANRAPVMYRNRSSIESPTDRVPTRSSRGLPTQYASTTRRSNGSGRPVAPAINSRYGQAPANWRASARSPTSSCPATPYSKNAPESAGPQNPCELGGNAYRANRTGPGTAQVLVSGTTHVGFVAGAAHQLQTAHRLLRTRGIGELDGEAHVDEDPLTGCRCLVEQADVHATGGALHLDERELVAEALDHLDHPSRDPETHLRSPPSAAARRPPGIARRAPPRRRPRRPVA